MTRENEIKQVLYEYLDAGLVKNDMERLMTLVADDVVGIGMGEQGFVRSKTDLYNILLDTLKPHDHIEYQLDYEHVEVRFVTDTVANICAQIIVTCVEHQTILKSGLSQSLSVRYEQGKWLITALHASPMMITTESIHAYPLKFAEQFLSNLRTEVQNEILELVDKSILGGLIGMYPTDKGYKLYLVNNSMLAYLGYMREEFTNRFADDVLQTVHQEDRAQIVKTMAEALEQRKDFVASFRMVKKDGSYLWVMAQCKIIEDEQGVLLVGFYTDVTEMVELQLELKKRTQELEKKARELELKTDELEAKTKALLVSDERFRIALEKSSNTIFEYDFINGEIVRLDIAKQGSDVIMNLSEAKAQLIEGGRIDAVDFSRLTQVFTAVRKGKQQASCIVKVDHYGEKETWSRISLTGIKDEQQSVIRAVGMIEDITKQKEAEIAYAREEQYRKAILVDTLASYVINFTENVFEDCKIESPYCIKVDAGISYDETMRKKAWVHFKEEDRRQFLETFSRPYVLEKWKQGEREFHLEYRDNSPNGRELWLKTTLRLVLDSVTDEVKGFMYVMDIDKKKREELEWKRKLESDPMTGIYNKGAVISRVETKLKTYVGVYHSAFLMIDIDYFKDINDEYGHPFGDKILMGAARILQENFRENDVVGRLGGDEFCVYLYGVSSSQQIEKSVLAISEGIHNLYKPSNGLPGVSCSIGITTCKGKAKSFAQIYQEADYALYQAKRKGRNQYAFYDESL